MAAVYFLDTFALSLSQCTPSRRMNTSSVETFPLQSRGKLPSNRCTGSQNVNAGCRRLPFDFGRHFAVDNCSTGRHSDMAYNTGRFHGAVQVAFALASSREFFLRKRNVDFVSLSNALLLIKWPTLKNAVLFLWRVSKLFSRQFAHIHTPIRINFVQPSPHPELSFVDKSVFKCELAGFD